METSKPGLPRKDAAGGTCRFAIDLAWGLL